MGHVSPLCTQGPMCGKGLALEKGDRRDRLRDMLVAENTLAYLLETVQR